MRNVKICLVVCIALMCTTIAIATGPSNDSSPQVIKEHWRFHDGHWGFWYPADNAWYYTDGNHWFYNDADVWRPYVFDRKFGREGFERGEYKMPEKTVVVPRHGVWRK
jgi:hypothetical protein